MSTEASQLTNGSDYVLLLLQRNVICLLWLVICLLFINCVCLFRRDQILHLYRFSAVLRSDRALTYMVLLLIYSDHALIDSMCLYCLYTIHSISRDQTFSILNAEIRSCTHIQLMLWSDHALFQCISSQLLTFCLEIRSTVSVDSNQRDQTIILNAMIRTYCTLSVLPVKMFTDHALFRDQILHRYQSMSIYCLYTDS